MTLPAGTRIGAYEITGQLGAGGMGEVYRARDTKLDRDIALKILPESFARDPDRVMRFEREAKTLASLNHANIAQIYGMESVEGSGAASTAPVRALVMELVEGEDLSPRIARGPIPLDDALPIARQIAEALEAAHELGIIHRDLKPANIKVRADGTVKVLDFGLAKALDQSGGRVGSGGAGGNEVLNSPTITSPAMTLHGVILGTAAYMAPEQAKGKIVDRRADIWAFGCVLYEMLTGRRAFDGEDTTEILGSIVKMDPDWSAVPAATPPCIRTLLERCLAKDRSQRLQHMGDARIELADLANRGDVTLPRTASSRGNRITYAGIGALSGAIVAAATVLMLGRPAPVPERSPTRFQLYPAAGESMNESASLSIAVSRDGRLVAKVVEPQRRIRVWSIDSGESRLLDSTDNADALVFSPDGKQLAFRRSNQLFKVGLDGAGLQTLGIVNGTVGPIEWTDDGLIVSGSLRGGLKSIRADGGELTSLLDVEGNEVALRAPAAIPGSRLLLYQSMRGPQNAPQVILLERESGRRHELASGATPRYVNGFLLWNQATFNGRVVAATFDLGSFALGAPAPLLGVNEVASSTFFTGLAVSPNGTIARIAGDSAAATSIVWVDRSGHEEVPAIAAGHIWEQPRISPDGTRVAAANREGGNPDIWIVELSRRISTRFTLAPGEDESPIWSQGRILFRGGSGGGLQSKPADGSASETELKVDLNMGPGSNPHFVSVSPDGSYLAAYGVSAANGEDVFIVALHTGRVTSFAATAASERSPMFSPDGRWIAYVSDESGRDEVYARPFPGPGGKFQVSTNGGGEPVWNRNGRELFYREGRKMMSVAVSLSPTFSAATATMLFEGSYTESHRGFQNYDVSPDGKRFVMIKRDLEAARVPIHVAVDMIGELGRLTSQPH